MVANQCFGTQIHFKKRTRHQTIATDFAVALQQTQSITMVTCMLVHETKTYPATSRQEMQTSQLLESNHVSLMHLIHLYTQSLHRD